MKRRLGNRCTADKGHVAHESSTHTFKWDDCAISSGALCSVRKADVPNPGRLSTAHETETNNDSKNLMPPAFGPDYQCGAKTLILFSPSEMMCVGAPTHIKHACKPYMKMSFPGIT